MSATAKGGGLSRLVRGLIRSPLERESELHRRYRELSRQIDETPTNMTIYALRGELNLERRDYEQAKADFAAVLDLAEALDDTRGWLVLEQVMRDRALYGLNLAERKLRPRR